MNDMLRQRKYLNIVLGVSLIGLFLFANLPIFIITYLNVMVAMILRSGLSAESGKNKIAIATVYMMIFALQVVFCVSVVYDAEDTVLVLHLLRKIFAVFMLTFPLYVERFMVSNKYVVFYPPSVEEIATVSFAEMKESTEKIVEFIKSVERVGKSLSPENIGEIIGGIDRHSSVKYVNNGSLTEEYFTLAENTLDDPHIYIAISNTGSSASEIISVFTRRQFNHASIAFDSDLKTIISYNGGENVYPPGLNPETIEYFHKKIDASVLVYKISATREAKEKIIDKVREINGTGSAYNMLGLVIKRSYKPNIMFCSQFVYSMLKIAELEYFTKKDGEVRPTDFIELDIYRKLQFAYEIKFK